MAVAPHALAAVLLLLGADATAMGAIKLDNYTFDRFLKLPGVSILVKFDMAYPYGEKEDVFQALCKLAYRVPNFLIGEVAVQDYGDKENMALQERFELKKEEFPAYYLYERGSEGPPERYVGFPDPTAKKPGTWDDEEDGEWVPPYMADVNLETLGTWLHTHGINLPSNGTIAELDEVARRIVKDGLQDTHLAEAEKLAGGAFKKDKRAQIYVKIITKVKEKGIEYIEQETARVRKIMIGKMSPEKAQDLKDKLNILRAFTV